MVIWLAVIYRLQDAQRSEHASDEPADADTGDELDDTAEDVSGIVPVVTVEPAAGTAAVTIAVIVVSDDINSPHSGSPSWLFGQSIKFG